MNIHFFRDKRVYVKKLEQVGDFAVWQVNGEYIRDKVDREFSNFGQHFRFRFIPKYEFWLDREYVPGEAMFYVDHLLVEWNLMAKGMSYFDANARAHRIEKKERAKSELMKKLISASANHQNASNLSDTVQPNHNNKAAPITQQTHINNTVLSATLLSGDTLSEKLYKQKLTGYPTEFCVWVVNGEIVRDLYFLDYTEGGHHFVYKFIPLKEVWLDDDLYPDEREFVLLHELHERFLMSKGMPYDRAHRSASIIEYQCRVKPKRLAGALKTEVTKNRLILV